MMEHIFSKEDYFWGQESPISTRYDTAEMRTHSLYLQMAIMQHRGCLLETVVPMSVSYQYCSLSTTTISYLIICILYFSVVLEHV